MRICSGGAAKIKMKIVSMFVCLYILTYIRIKIYIEFVHMFKTNGGIRKNTKLHIIQRGLQP